MGTRSLTIFKDDAGIEIATLYRQFDGYPSGHGEELLNILKNHVLINGIGMEDDINNSFNGMGCLAAYTVAQLKKDIGNFYLQTSGGHKESYNYIVYPGEKGEKDQSTFKKTYQKINLKIEDYDSNLIYDGPLDDWDATEPSDGE